MNKSTLAAKIGMVQTVVGIEFSCGHSYNKSNGPTWVMEVLFKNC